MKNFVLGFKRNNVNSISTRQYSSRQYSSRQYSSPTQINTLLQSPAVPRQHVSMFSSVRRPCAQLQFGGTPGCGCGK